MDVPANRIRELREARGITQTRLAEMIGVSKGYMSELESGRKTINSLRLQSVAKALRCGIPDLFSGQTRNDLAEISDVFTGLTPDQRRAVLDHARALLASERNRD